MSKDVKYFNFPIQLLDGFLINTTKCLNDISNYAVYDRSIELEGTQEAKFKSAGSFLGINFGNIKQAMRNGQELHNSIDFKSPKVGITVSTWWEFYKNEKTEFEKICLIAFLALKSIAQKKAYCKVVNNYWFARMAGKTHSCEFEQLSDSIKKYTNDYQARKIKRELIESWGLVTYSRNIRGFYVSFSMNLEDLVLQAEIRRKSTKQKQYKEREQLAIKNALMKINGKQP